MAELGEIPWSLSDLNKPTYRWLDASSQVRSLLLQGEPFQGHATEVFAYYATPGTLQHSHDAPASLPAIVLLHGDGETASSRWVQDWASRGYAAMAIDLGGRGPDGTRLKLAGPADTPTIKKLARLERARWQHWPYHAVADTLLARSLLREFEEVHEDRVGTLGMGWGGILFDVSTTRQAIFPTAAPPCFSCSMETTRSFRFRPSSAHTRVFPAQRGPAGSCPRRNERRTAKRGKAICVPRSFPRRTPLRSTT